MGTADHNGREAARVLLAASDQIDLALRQSQPSVDALGEALQNLANVLAATGKDGRSEALIALRAEMLRAITCLQYHDRMTQHLSHVRDYLAGSAEQMSSREDRAEEQWTGLHNTLREKLLSETQRMRLGRIFPSELVAEDSSQARDARGASKPGDIDLF